MKYYIIAGEASGDLHGSNLMYEILYEDPNAEIRYWGGDRMQSILGHTTMVKHIRDLAIMGFVEVLFNLRTVLGNIRFCKKDILKYNPDAIIFIDYPGFNLKIAKYTHKKGFKNFYYISPQIWAWKQGRIKAMRRDIYKLCYILPSEREFYASVDFPQAEYVGHPLLDEIKKYQPTPLNYKKKVVALLPGSRKQELKKVLPSMINLARNHKDYQFVIAGMTLLGEKFYNKLIPSDVSNVSVEYDRTYDILSQSYAGIICSGTATLEAALFKVPQVVCYRGNAITIGIAAFFIKRMGKLKYISLPNLITDSPLVKELIQQEVNTANLEAEFEKITSNKASRQEMLKGYDNLIEILGNAGASQRTTKIICNDIIKK